MRHERTYPLSAVHLDWSTGVKGTSLCVVLDNASRKILSGGEFKRQSAETSVKLLKEALDKYASIKKIREVLTDRVSCKQERQRWECNSSIRGFLQGK